MCVYERTKLKKKKKEKNGRFNLSDGFFPVCDVPPLFLDPFSLLAFLIKYGFALMPR